MKIYNTGKNIVDAVKNGNVKIDSFLEKRQSAFDKSNTVARSRV